MKKEHFFPVEVNIMNNERIARLIERYGSRGLGAYFSMLIELRQHENYKFGPSAVRTLSRIIKMRKNECISIVEDFDLFEKEGEGEDCLYSSPYMNRVMEAYDEKIRKHVMAGKKKAELSQRNAFGHFTSDAGVKEKNIKENTTTVVVEKEANSSSNLKPLKSWEEYFDQATKDESWIEVLKATSGMGKYFPDYQQDIMENFRQHVRLYGTEGEIRSERDIKTYIVNYLRPGTVTHNNLLKWLMYKEKEKQRQSPYRYETIDPETKARSYYGNPIPPDAPPRPNDNVAWSNELQKWL